jgi:hypothetical protein
MANPPTVNQGQPVSFTVQLSNTVNVLADLKFKWKVTGGVAATEEGASITVRPNADEVLAEVAIEGLPADCPNTARGRCLILGQS